jgi:hypothetical protein
MFVYRPDPLSQRGRGLAEVSRNTEHLAEHFTGHYIGLWQPQPAAFAAGGYPSSSGWARRRGDLRVGLRARIAPYRASHSERERAGLLGPVS